MFLSCADHAALSRSWAQSGRCAVGAVGATGGSVSPWAVQSWVGIRHRAACGALRSGNALCHMAAIRHQGGSTKQVQYTGFLCYCVITKDIMWHISEWSGFVMWRLCCSIRAYIEATKAKTVLEPVFLDASEPWEKWAGLPQSSCDIITAINLLQYSPFTTAEVWRQYWFMTFFFVFESFKELWQVFCL